MIEIPSNPKVKSCLEKLGIISPTITYSLSDVRISETCVYNVPPNYTPSPYLFLFDLDSTLTYHQKTLFIKHPDDIHLIPNRLKYLRQLFYEGYTIVVFTNQATMNASSVELRIKNFLKLVNIPIYVFASVKKDKYRKPEIGMWKLFLSLTKLKPKKIYFTGDALGRHFDFADSDKLFAEKIGAQIFEPEEIFEPFDPSLIIHSKREVVILVGAPGSNKSTFARTHLPKHRLISKDIHKQNEMRYFLSAIRNNENVVVDDTNPSIEVRQQFIVPAKKLGYSIILLYFVRAGQNYNEKREEKVPQIAYHIFYKKLQVPTETEGDVYIVY